MSFVIKKAIREDITIIGVCAGPTGSGKTYSALELALGLAGKKRVLVIDTERRRATHYADTFDFDHVELDPPFSPDRYGQAIDVADPKIYGCVVVDQFSHEHAGEGGLLDMHEAALERMAGNDWKKRESCKMAAWVQPKGSHKKLVNYLLRLPIHLIFCLRAEEKIEMVRGKDGGWEIQPKQSATGKGGWIPICEKNLPYEATFSFLFTADKPGVPQPIKLQEQHKPFFPLDRVVTRKAGELMARWAAGETEATRKALPPTMTLAEVKARIDAATKLEELDEVIALAKQLPEKERNDARHYFGIKKAELGATKKQSKKDDEKRERQPGED